MKCLSVKNPFSYLICAGLKDVENRSWKTNYRGEILIHVSGKRNDYFSVDENLTPVFWEHENKIDWDGRTNTTKFKLNYTEIFNGKIVPKINLDNKNLTEFKLGKYIHKYGLFESQTIIGSIILEEIIENSSSKWAEHGDYHWVLSHPKLFLNPIKNIKGRLGLWDTDIDINPEIINLDLIPYEKI